jgi:proteasome lid subunit RPN8/RPN11
MNILTTLAIAFVQLPGATLDTAMEHAMADAETLTAEYEAGGAIYQCGSVYVYSAPQTQRKHDRVAIDVVSFADTCHVVALYHTHPRGDARFSKADIAASCTLQLPSYIKPHGGALRVFDCSTIPETVRASAWQNPVLSTGKEA